MNNDRSDEKANEVKPEEQVLRELQKLTVFEASAELEARLFAIPEQFPKKVFPWSRVAVLGVAAASVLLVFSHFPSRDGDVPPHLYSEQEIETAKRELALAFHYLSDASQQTGLILNAQLGESSAEALYKAARYPLVNRFDEGEKDENE